MTETTNLIALRDAREQAEQLLSQRYAEDLIDQAELERRMEGVERAETLGEIEALTNDLVEPGSAEQALVPRVQAQLARADEAPAQHSRLAVFGEVKQAGAWLPARHNQALAVFGSNKLDFREARLGPGVTTVEVKAIFGEVKVLVPPGLPVEIEVSPIFGGVDVDDGMGAAAGDADGPRLHISGLAVFGSVEVREREPGESARDARKRHKQERRQLKAARAEQKKLTAGDP